MEDFPPSRCHIILENICLFTNRGIYLVLDVHANDNITICHSELIQDSGWL